MEWTSKTKMELKKIDIFLSLAGLATCRKNSAGL